MKVDKTTLPKPIAAEDKQKLFENSIWMTVKDTAKYLSRTENAIRILICRKILRAYHLGRTVYLKRSEIDTLIESSVLNGGY
jgi:excisionase family DNA binding protein